MTTKADHYVEQLENARCEGNWDAVPELVRKVRKHAPARSCLVLAAETECAISSVTTAGSRPSAVATARDLDVANRVPKLESAIEQERTNVEDRYQAQVCVGWLHWVVGDYGLAVERLPKSTGDRGSGFDPVNLACEWTNVCVLKSAYLRANCLVRAGQRTDALEALQSAAPAMRRVESGKGVRKQLRYWSELFLTEYCMLSGEAIEKHEIRRQDPSTLAPFRSWADYWDVMQAPVTGGFGFKGSVPRRQIWAKYHTALSHVLQADLPYEPGFVKRIPGDLPPRSQLRAEVKYVESAYGTLLLAETAFPRAHEERDEVEAFVKRLVKNWSILCGRGWRDEDLGPGGRGAASRGVLELLYNAATRTYHSTSILRSLFVVHLSLAEFELAFKAFDAYLEIIKKGKARVDKTGEPEPSLDDDDTVLETMARGVAALCRYGHRQAGDKARRLGAELEDWLSRLPQIKSPENGTPAIAEDASKSDLHPPVAPHVVALAWQAIGLSHAHWSRLTSEAGSRTEVQSKAIRCFRKSLAAEFGRSKDIRSFYGLALLLAERRELTAAIELTRSALMSHKGQDQQKGPLCGPYWQERTLVPLWHLLALLLSARQDYAMAFRACEGALEQFKDPAALFGKGDVNFRSEHLNGTGTSPAAPEYRRGLVDDMDDSEREGILEIKMTQLALIELTEGPDAAVNASHELLTMFTRLFGNVTLQPPAAADRTLAQPPKTAGTLRSIRGSIFGTKTDRSAPSIRQPSASAVSEASAAVASRPSTANSVTTARPAIQVTAENDAPVEGTRSRRASSAHRQRSDSVRRNSLKKRNRSGSRPRPDTASTYLHQPTIVDGDSFFTPLQEHEQANAFFSSSKPPQVRSPSSSRGKAASMSSYLSSAPKSGDYSDISADVTHATPHLLPLIQFSKDKQRSQRTTILIKIWLTVAGFYRRAHMLDDCRGAIAEAQKLVQGLEADSRREQSSVAGPQSAGWAEDKSVDDTWGDVWTELGLLALAQGEPNVARSDFEQALTHCPDHPAATVNLSNILLDVYGEKLLPPPVVPPLDNPEAPPGTAKTSAWGGASKAPRPCPLGLGPSAEERAAASIQGPAAAAGFGDDQLPAPYKATRLPLVDRLAARDRAFALLTGLTRLGTGWDQAEAWFALARAYEESGQADKAREVLWWCVELEEATGVRGWRCLGGGYLV
ncbi:hypothetical protein CDD83_6495 [Cordyceps sp. RAO-2017]|nr:hypothetical protein CDD83_6495 [Cordyceps sp. RAO-2017]